MPDVGAAFSRYRILDRLGRGGMGEVFLAVDTSLERRVAIKFLPRDLADDLVARERFVREARAAASLDHPHICVVHETLEADGIPCIVMEFVEGETLEQRLERGPLPLVDAIDLAGEIAEALDAAHAKHLVHRDVKPANVMLTRAGHAKVMDFGVARQLRAIDREATEEDTRTSLTEMGTTVGTLAYMSPEQLSGRPVDHRSDVFSFGIVLYEMLAGAHPFARGSPMATAAAILSEPPPPVARKAGDVPSRLADLVGAMLEKAPERRIPSMQRVCEHLRSARLDVSAIEPSADARTPARFARRLRSREVAIPAAVGLVAVILVGTWWGHRQARVRWAREVALPEIERLIGENDVWRNLLPPYRLAEQVEAVIPGDERLAALFARCSLEIDVTTEPAGARVYMKAYDEPDAPWSFLGLSPIRKARVPIGIFRWKFEKEGHETVVAAASTWDVSVTSESGDPVVPAVIERTLDGAGSLPPGMVRVRGGDTAAGRLPDFFIDRHETTNREYKRFVEAGAYRTRAYWRHPFVSNGRELPWEEAMREFVDATGQPGPATWFAGDYPEGQGDHPVSGVSWYEAAAYAEYAEKVLPTAAHWGLARGEATPMIRWPQLGGFAVLAPFSNFGGQGTVPVGSLPGLTAFGAVDMAGNVREWCSNDARRGRVVRGGAWEDNTYEFGYVRQADGMNRSARNGFRLARYPAREAIAEVAFALESIHEPRDFARQRPVADVVFDVFREQFSYDNMPLRAEVESRQDHGEGWALERVSFDAAYGGERIVAHLFLPERATPPYQTVIYFPGSAAVWQRSSNDIERYYEFPMFLSFLVRNGRAVVFPVYKGTFERGSPELAPIHIGADSHLYSSYLVQLVKDLRRSIDYVETRPDIDPSKLAFYGMSWGGALGAIVLAVEDRFRASVLLSGGVFVRARPEADALNYVTRVRTPALMLNGRFDPLIDSIHPMFDLLGTPEEHKRFVLYDTDHVPPRKEFVKETLAWLDRYLGPVR